MTGLYKSAQLNMGLLGKEFAERPNQASFFVYPPFP
jgi:hypothetical protein